ncbi:BlaI/MecI/CopY family transcriptional regulator [Propionibacteriaceae bacterium Y1700]|uniref:BlaI/MecI/CopY family transcriptional regulator n=1 Tax=Microlunatus sp. Y1700 TaxID=3418487 RepID=UPI003DA737FD
MITSLGELERAVLERLWAADEPLSVREVHSTLATGRDLAYTTVMTVLDRMAKKGLVQRERADTGRAWLYRASQTRDEMSAEVMDTAMGDRSEDRSAALLAFVDRVSADEADLLREALARIEADAAKASSKPASKSRRRRTSS